MERINEKQETIEQEFFTCDCLGEGILISKWNDDNHPEVYFSMYSNGLYTPKPSLWQRIKYAWNHIKTGKIYEDCIVFNFESAKKVANYINKITENE